MSNYGYAAVSQVSAGPEAPDVYKKEKKKMGWFTRWFDRKVKESWHRARDEEYAKPVLVSRGPDRIDANGLSMKIYSADGGTILEFSHYDSVRDRHSTSLHVISQTDNFEERVSQCITMELLRQGIAK